MKWIKCGLALMLCFSLLALVAAGADGYPKTIVDDANRTITIDKPVEKIVPLVTWSYEPLYMLGANDKIVGVTTDAQQVYPWLEGILNKTVVGTYKQHNYEKIIELRPDIVITQARYAGALDQNLSGIKVVVLDFSRQSDFEHDLNLLAELVGGQDKAKEFLAWRTEQLDSLKKKTDLLKNDSKKSVYIEWSDTPWVTAGAGSAKDTLILRAGGVNIAHNLTGARPTVDPEWVLKENPQAVVYSSTFPAPSPLTGYSLNSTDAAKGFLANEKKRDGLKDTDAAKKDHLYVLDQICVESTRNFIGAQYLAKWLYPDQFKDLDPEAVHKEYFEKWLGVPYKGIWAYPQAS
ncbi:MAG: Cobalamin-binding protein precursor [Methanosaeta sp. PtaB.Bin018]|jgi:iron complex transport system substrate-binding protein|nr:MAG: Cobalamin-binding protein precursor [Methanosaeta sp. PtaB.Bin018]